MPDCEPKPLVSILIPVFNRSDLLQESVTSACRQVFQDFEIVIIDNASTDNTWAICQALASQDSRIRVFRNEVNIGPVRNWERCIGEARGKLGKLLFSDDLIDPTYLEQTVPELSDDAVGLVFTAVEIGSKPGQGRIVYRWAADRKPFTSREFIERLLFRGDVPVSPCAALFRMKDLQSSLQFARSVPDLSDLTVHGAGIDMLLYLLTAVRYQRVVHIGKPLVFFRAHDNSISIEKGSDFINDCHDRAKLWFAFAHSNHLIQDRLAVRIAKRQTQLNVVETFSRILQRNRSRPQGFISLRFWLASIFDMLAKFSVRVLRRLGLA